MVRMKLRPCLAGLLLAVGAAGASVSAAEAAERVVYSYDTRGRLVSAVRTLTPPDASEQVVTAAYTYDDADNRIARAVSGAADAGPDESDPDVTDPTVPVAPPRAIVIPDAGGYLVIPVP